MKAANIPNVMMPFVQVDSKLSRSYDGTGLGLPLTQSFVELHGGEMVIESALGEGTAVTVTMPVVESEASRPVGDNVVAFNPQR